jgi:hypothetical protein
MTIHLDTGRIDDVLHVVYVSTLSPDFDHTLFATICRTSRTRNAQQGVTGLLLFDGLQFVQWLSGPHAKVTALMAAIARDERHHDVRVVYESPTPPMSPPSNWRAGFVGPEAVEAFLATVGQAQSFITDGLDRLVGDADFEPEN